MLKFNLLLVASALKINSELSWNNKPWESDYKWDQSSVNKIYQVPDSHSYFKDSDLDEKTRQRNDAWNDAQYNQSDEVKFLDKTKTLNADYLENLQPAAEYHLREGRTGTPADEEP